MGVLDDAIRQHIELKRQHGASEDELERKEAEALGPARREVSAEPEGSDAAASEAVGDAPATAEPTDEPFDERQTRVVAPTAGEQASADGPVDDWLELEDDDEPLHSAERDPVPDDDAPEDVLEETPEFLQETPEHDRLWFEQKPPRDFDFDDK